MSIDSERKTIIRLNREIIGLRKKEASENTKIVQSQKKMNAANNAASKASSSSTMQMKIRESDRHAKDMQRAHDNQAKIGSDILRKSNDLVRAQERLSNAEIAEQKKQENITKKVKREQEARLRNIEKMATYTPQLSDLNLKKSDKSHVQYDVFISHASEDKESFVREFAELAISNGINVWYDEQSLTWGDSLWQSIDKGLANSHFGVVVLSESFFAKNWTKHELDGLINRELSGEKCILPIWHKITKDELMKLSPSLAGRLALNTSIQSIQEIVDELKKMVDEIKNKN